MRDQRNQLLQRLAAATGSQPSRGPEFWHVVDGLLDALWPLLPDARRAHLRSDRTETL